MRIVILAAGVGSRLEGLEDTPKALVTLEDGRSILEQQLENIALFHSVEDVVVVVGYKRDHIRVAFPHLSYIDNLRFSETNTAKSLLLGMQDVEAGPVLWLNGDVVFHHTLLGPLIARDRTSMVVNHATVSEEEIKFRTDGVGRILEVSKQVDEPEGEALGINYCAEGDVAALQKALKECADSDYFEAGVEKCIQAGVEVWAHPVVSHDCVEVDFAEDLERANLLLHEWL